MIENIGAYSQVDYDRGYQQGRADVIEQIEEYWEMQNNLAYEQGRADAIKEYKNALHKEFEKSDKKLLHWLDFVEMYNKVAEQLKSQNIDEREIQNVLRFKEEVKGNRHE